MSFGSDLEMNSKQSSNLFNRGLLFFSLAGIAFFALFFLPSAVMQNHCTIQNGCLLYW